MSTVTDTRLMNSLNAGIVSDFSDLSDATFLEGAADYIRARDYLETLLRDADKNIRALCLEYGRRESMWGVNPTILRRELKLRGHGV